MNWYKTAQQFDNYSNMNIGQLSKQIDILFEQYASFPRNLTPQEEQKRNEIGEILDYCGKIRYEKFEELKEKSVESIKAGKPHEVPGVNFMDYHNTGNIPSDAYSDNSVKDMAWLGNKDEKYPTLLKSKEYDGEVIEFRQKDEINKYVKTDESGEIVRDEKGMALYLSPEEVEQAGHPKTDTGISAFNGQGQPIGYASNEWGADGIWVADEYQKKGIGVDLLHEFRKQFKPDRKIGQMTSSGRNMTRAYHKKLIQKALQQGKHVPQEVLDEYEGEL